MIMKTEKTIDKGRHFRVESKMRWVRRQQQSRRRMSIKLLSSGERSKPRSRI